MTGIYKIENLVNEKVYIGQAVNISRRWNEHKFHLKNNNHYNKHLQNAWNKYGEENFKFEPIEECLEIELDEKEIYWIAKFKDNSYNLTFGGEGRDTFSLHDEETKKLISSKISKSNIGKPKSIEHRNKISKALLGKPTWNKGLKGEYAASIETRQKLSQDTSNRRWIHNEFENKYVKYWELDKYLEQGFILGRLNKNSLNSLENQF